MVRLHGTSLEFFLSVISLTAAPCIALRILSILDVDETILQFFPDVFSESSFCTNPLFSDYVRALVFGHDVNPRELLSSVNNSELLFGIIIALSDERLFATLLPLSTSERRIAAQKSAPEFIIELSRVDSWTADDVLAAAPRFGASEPFMDVLERFSEDPKLRTNCNWLVPFLKCPSTFARTLTFFHRLFPVDSILDEAVCSVVLRAIRESQRFGDFVPLITAYAKSFGNSPAAAGAYLEHICSREPSAEPMFNEIRALLRILPFPDAQVTLIFVTELSRRRCSQSDGRLQGELVLELVLRIPPLALTIPPERLAFRLTQMIRGGATRDDVQKFADLIGTKSPEEAIAVLNIFKYFPMFVIEHFERAAASPAMRDPIRFSILLFAGVHFLTSPGRRGLHKTVTAKWFPDLQISDIWTRILQALLAPARLISDVVPYGRGLISYLLAFVRMESGGWVISFLRTAEVRQKIMLLELVGIVTRIAPSIAGSFRALFAANPLSFFGGGDRDLMAAYGEFVCQMTAFPLMALFEVEFRCLLSFGSFEYRAVDPFLRVLRFSLRGGPDQVRWVADFVGRTPEIFGLGNVIVQNAEELATVRGIFQVLFQRFAGSLSLSKLPRFVRGIRKEEGVKIQLLWTVMVVLKEKFANVIEACFEHVEALAEASDDPELQKVFDEMVMRLSDKI
jgi:hypothetical protein